MDNIDIRLIKYRCANVHNVHDNKNSIKVLGLDTEAFTTGRCFMIATSLGDVFSPNDMLKVFFTRKYRYSNFVVYNLKYDEGALLQNLPYDNLKELRVNNKTVHNGYTYKIIPRKMLRISRGKNGVTFYDLANFFKVSLDRASKDILGEGKHELPTKELTYEYVFCNWRTIADYCIQDAKLVKQLADVLISKYESFGVYPRKLYSTAYISYQYFYKNCKYPTVKRYWNYYKDVLEYAMLSYNGGKFEVTQKGLGYYYEYDVKSQYPSIIANLIDISQAIVVNSDKYIKECQYAFIKCNMFIPVNINNPVAIKKGSVNTFPCGEITKVITKQEYDYLISQGVKIDIINGWWLYIKNVTYPFKVEMTKLLKVKDTIDKKKNKVDYIILKYLTTSLYGKFVQLIKDDKYYKASTCWNPIFGSIVTANGRIQVTKMQQQHDSVVAVHTDSIISTEPLDIPTKGKIGSFIKDVEGDGVILGSGIYQIGDKNKFRGFDSKITIIDLISGKNDDVKVNIRRPLTWKEVIFHSWDVNLINKFTEIERKLNVNFDQKRLWLDDWKTFQDVFSRSVDSVPLFSDSILGV